MINIINFTTKFKTMFFVLIRLKAGRIKKEGLEKKTWLSSIYEYNF